MEIIGKYFEREVYWIDYEKYVLPTEDWLCLAISNNQPEFVKFETFVRKSISSNILEFKGHGNYGERLHDYFDEIVNIMEVMENHSEINVMTTWHNDESLADTFWQCFFATCLTEAKNLDNIKIICVDLEGKNRIQELKNYISKFEKGWLPD